MSQFSWNLLLLFTLGLELALGRYRVVQLWDNGEEARLPDSAFGLAVAVAKTQLLSFCFISALFTGICCVDYDDHSGRNAGSYRKYKPLPN